MTEEDKNLIFLFMWVQKLTVTQTRFEKPPLSFLFFKNKTFNQFLYVSLTVHLRYNNLSN